MPRLSQYKFKACVAETLFDFPEIYKLCCARELRGNYVSYCMKLAESGSGLCGEHEKIRVSLPDLFTWNEKMEVRIS